MHISRDILVLCTRTRHIILYVSCSRMWPRDRMTPERPERPPLRRRLVELRPYQGAQKRLQGLGVLGVSGVSGVLGV